LYCKYFIAEDEKVTVSYRLKKCDDAEGGGISITPTVHPTSAQLAYYNIFFIDDGKV
jgi:hypothetical protein